MITFDSPTLGEGVVVGRENGETQLWNGATWYPLHGAGDLKKDPDDQGWGSGVVDMITVPGVPANAGPNAKAPTELIVGLRNGATEQWNGTLTDGTGQNNWTELQGSGTGTARPLLHQSKIDGAGPTNSQRDNWELVGNFGGSDTLWKANDFVKSLTSGWFSLPRFGSSGSIGSSADPVFGGVELPRAGTAYGFTIDKSFNIWQKQCGTDASGKGCGAPISFKGKILTQDADGSGVWGGFRPDQNAYKSVLIASGRDADLLKEGMGVSLSLSSISGQDKIRNLINLGLNTIPNGTTLGKQVEVTYEYGPETKTAVGWELVFPDGYQRAKFPANPTDEEARIYRDFAVNGGGVMMTASRLPSVTAAADFRIFGYGFYQKGEGLRGIFEPSMGAVLAAGLVGSLEAVFGAQKQVEFNWPNILEKSWEIPLLPGISATFTGDAGFSVKLGPSVSPTARIEASFNVGNAFEMNVMHPELVGYSSDVASYAELDLSDLKKYESALLGNYFGVGSFDAKLMAGLGIGFPRTVRIVGGLTLAEIATGPELEVDLIGCVSPAAGTCPTWKNSMAKFGGTINNGKFSKAAEFPPGNGKWSAETAVGNVLTVLQPPPQASLGRVAVGQLVSGPGVPQGTYIVRKLPDREIGGKAYGQWELDCPAPGCAPVTGSSDRPLEGAELWSYVTRGSTDSSEGSALSIVPGAKLAYNLDMALIPSITQYFTWKNRWVLAEINWPLPIVTVPPRARGER